MRYVLRLWSIVMISSLLAAQSSVSAPASDTSHRDGEVQELLKAVAAQQKSIDRQQEAIANQQKQLMDQRQEIETLKQQLRSNSWSKSAGNDGGSPLQTAATFNTAAVDHSKSSAASDSPLQEKRKGVTIVSPHRWRGIHTGRILLARQRKGTPKFDQTRSHPIE